MNNIHNTRKKTGSIRTSANYITYLLNTRVDWIIRISANYITYTIYGILTGTLGGGGGREGGGYFRKPTKGTSQSQAQSEPV